MVQVMVREFVAYARSSARAGVGGRHRGSGLNKDRRGVMRGWATAATGGVHEYYPLDARGIAEAMRGGCA